MLARPLTSASVNEATFEPLSELPPFTQFTPGSSEFTIAQIVGEEGEPGAIAVVKFARGGLKYIDMPMASSAYLAEGSLTVTNTDGSFEVKTGEGFYTPEGWNGSIEATSPVTLILHV